MDLFLKKLMDAASAAGIEACEAYLVESDSFSASSTEGELTEYKSNSTRGLGLRGIMGGRMGYASTQAFDDEAISQLVRGVVEGAELCEDDDVIMLYEGKDQLPELSLMSEGLSAVSAGEKLARLSAMEKRVKGYDGRIEKSASNVVRTGRHTVRIVNSYGMDRSYTEDMCMLYGESTAREAERVSSGFYGVAARNFDELDADRIGSEIAERAIRTLHAHTIPSGPRRVIFTNEAMTDLLGTFCGIFSAENAHKGISLLKGRVGQSVAASCVTLVDDPLLKAGLGARPFDDEGVASSAHTLIENGTFLTFLHNLKTARKDGVKTTGNASKAGYASPVHVAPSNLYFRPGQKTLKELLEAVGNGLVITEVSGLHAGANPASGDFSLLSKGYVFENGQPGDAVEQITVAGNFYDLLKNIREFASDLVFPMGGIGSPSADAGELSVSGC